MKRRAILLLTMVGAAMVLSSTMTLALDKQCKTYDSITDSGICYGTEERDTLLGTQGPNVMFARRGDDTLKGFGDTDGLHGDEGSDKLFGGAGGDSLLPGPGNDMSAGGAGGDVYSFEINNWGKDTIRDLDTGNTVHFDVGTDLTIRLVSDPARPEVKNEVGTSTVNWDDNVINHVTNQGSGDDRISGNAAANNIDSFAGGGDDDVLARSGNDSINVADGADGDFVDCGENAGDNDVAVYDGPTQFSLGDLVTNCEDARPQ
jgi:Ca2+-binding RTX toxin-like protein